MMSSAFITGQLCYECPWGLRESGCNDCLLNSLNCCDCVSAVCFVYRSAGSFCCIPAGVEIERNGMFVLLVLFESKKDGNFFVRFSVL